MLKAVVFGAGNIGRGFLGQLFHQSGYQTTFVDVVEPLVEELHRRGSYPLRIVDGGVNDLTIDRVDAVLLDDPDAVRRLKEADLAATAVGVRHLPGVAPTVARAVRERIEEGGGPLDIVLCENLLGAPEIFRRHVEEAVDPPAMRKRVSEQLGLVASVVSRMVPIVTPEQRAEDPLLVVVEPYCVLPVDGTAFRAGRPPVRGFRFSDKIHAYEERKLFTHNMGHAVAAYLGHLAGYTYIWEAVEDPAIGQTLTGAFRETGEALIRRHGFAPEEQRSHEEDLLVRFRNRRLGDTVFRVGRDPLRKLGPNDRLVGAARLCIEQGITPLCVAQAVAAGFRFDPPEDESAVALQKMLREEGIQSVLEKVCGLSPGSELYGLVLDAWDRIKP